MAGREAPFGFQAFPFGAELFSPDQASGIEQQARDDRRKLRDQPPGGARRPSGAEPQRVFQQIERGVQARAVQPKLAERGNAGRYARK